MRLILRDSERRPDPEPAKTDDRRPMFVGTALWLIALVALLAMLGPLLASDNGWWLWTCVAGIGLGLIGIAYAHRKHS